MASDPSTNTPKLTESGLARLLGVSRQAVHDLVKRGIISKDAAGLIDVAQAQAALANSVHPSSKTAAALQSTAPPPAPALQPPHRMKTAKTSKSPATTSPKPCAKPQRPKWPA